MKTIFIAVFEGVEAKNILRTSVLSTLLKERNIRIVLFTKNKERVEYNKKVFDDSRIIYEVVERPKIRGLDKFFSSLKFILLRTETTSLKRRMNFDINKNYFFFYFYSFLNWFLARPIFRRNVRFLDYLLVRNQIYTTYFEKYKPDLVFLAHLFDEPEIHLLREAKKQKIKTVGFINSWDKVTSRCILRLLPDKMIVFNEIVREEVKKYNEMNEENILVAGLPQYDHYSNHKPSSREVFFKKINVDPKKKLIVYAPIGRSFSDSDWEMIDFLHSLNKQGKFGNDIAILVRFQPNDFINKEELEKRPDLIYDYPGIRFSSKRGVDWDMDFADLQHLHDTLYHMSLVICYASSISIDAAVFDKPVINIDFELSEKKDLKKSPTQFFKSEHYKKALQTGGIRLVNSEFELVEWIKNYLDNPSLDKQGRQRLVQEQCQFVDGRAGYRVAKFIFNYLYE